MARITRIAGVDNRAIEQSVRAAYEADREGWQSMCGPGKLYPSIFDLIDVQERALKTKAVEQVGLVRSALNKLRMRRFLEAVEEGLLDDVTLEEVTNFMAR